jgi:hypothetical protein
MKAFKPLMISVIILLFFSLHANSQDTLRISRVRVSKTVLLSPKTNRIIEAWPRWVKVKEGYIIRKREFYYFNGQYWHATEDENNNLLAITPVSDKELIAADFKK